VKFPPLLFSRLLLRVSVPRANLLKYIPFPPVALQEPAPHLSFIVSVTLDCSFVSPQSWGLEVSLLVFPNPLSLLFLPVYGRGAANSTPPFIAAAQLIKDSLSEEGSHRLNFPSFPSFPSITTWFTGGVRVVGNPLSSSALLSTVVTHYVTARYRVLKVFFFLVFLSRPLLPFTSVPTLVANYRLNERFFPWPFPRNASPFRVYPVGLELPHPFRRGFPFAP